MDRYFNRKSFVTTIGVAGLGLGMSVAALGSAPRARAQDTATAPVGEGEQAMAQFDQMQAELYAAFTSALADELGTGDAAQVDSGIRAALATVIDGFAGDDLVTPGQATALKALAETAEVPIGPGPLMGHTRTKVVRAMGPDGGLPPKDAEPAAVAGELPTDGRQAMAERFYPDFTSALATELGAGNADDVDGAIRLAMISVIDGFAGEDLPLPIPTDALKAMVATAESPLGPGFLFGGHPGMTMRAFQGHGDDDQSFPGQGHGGEDGWFGERGERARGDREESGPATKDDANDDAANEDNDDEAEA